MSNPTNEKPKFVITKKHLLAMVKCYFVKMASTPSVIKAVGTSGEATVRFTVNNDPSILYNLAKTFKSTKITLSSLQLSISD